MTIPMGRSVRFQTGYDERAGGKYGIHGMNITFYFRGDEGAVQFCMSTDWVPWKPRPVSDRPELWGPRYQNLSTGTQGLYPMATDLGYHSLLPMYEGQDARPDCPFIGGACYYDGSGLNAEPLMVTLIYDGEEAMWEELESYYVSTFQPDQVPA